MNIEVYTCPQCGQPMLYIYLDNMEIFFPEGNLKELFEQASDPASFAELLQKQVEIKLSEIDWQKIAEECFVKIDAMKAHAEPEMPEDGIDFSFYNNN